MDSTHMLQALLQVLMSQDSSTEQPSTSLQSLLCSIAPVCKSWRETVHNLHTQFPKSVDITLEARERGPSQAWDPRTISSFTTWLARHSGLVSSITISHGPTNPYDACSLAAQQALASALAAAAAAGSAQPAAAAAAAAGSAQPAAAAAAAAAGSTQPAAATAAGSTQPAAAAAPPRGVPAVPTTGLQLHAYSSDCMGSKCILEALPAAHLTSLQLSLPEHSRTNPALPGCNHLASAFKRLTGLRSLSLAFEARQTLAVKTCDAISHLTNLTHLSLAVGLTDGTMTDNRLAAAMAALPQLQLLQLRCTSEDSLERWRLGHLKQLTELQFVLQDPACHLVQLQLPTQLKVLNVHAPHTNVFERSGYIEAPCNLTALQSLQAFSAVVETPLPDPVVQHLAQLTSLQDVSLGYASMRAAAGNMQDWSKLRHLQRLRIRAAASEGDEGLSSCNSIDRRELLSLLGWVGAVTSLTSLKLNVSMPPPSYWLHAGYPQRCLSHMADPLEHTRPPVLEPLGEAALPAPLHVLDHLTSLSRLQELQVVLGPLPGDPAHGVLTAELVVQLEPGSAKQLSVLTSLTSLQLRDLGAAVDDEAAAALASSLTNLRHLELPGSYIEHDATVDALRRLPLLTELRMGQDSSEEEEEGF